MKRQTRSHPDNNLYRAAFGNAGVALSVMNSDLVILEVNQQECELYGYTQEEMIGLNAKVLFPPEMVDRVSLLRHSFLEKKMIDFEAEALRKDGRRIPISILVNRIETPQGMRILTSSRNLTRRKQAEEKLHEQAALLDHAQDAILVRDLEDRILFWNKGAERIYGWTSEEVIGKNIRELLYKGGSRQFEQARNVVVEEGKWVGELRQLTKSGKEIFAECHWTLVQDDKGKPKSIFVINTDITEKKKLQAQFLRAQRMESIGTLVSGIAHDLNNVLLPILMAIKVLQKKFTDPQAQRMLEVLRSGSERGADMIKQLLAFARGAEGERIELQLKNLIKELEKVLKETFPRSIRIQTSVSEDLWPIHGDGTQLYQMLMNLCVNARDAMPESGMLKIQAENIVLDESYVRMNLEAKPGQFVLITVTDTGIGISANIINKIFEPFFTTKEQGQGTGLGLSTVLGIVKGHGGFIDVSSEIGKGTQFRVYLPVVTISPIQKVKEENSELPTGRGELILVVDDEAPIREITKETLETYGYRVLTASDGAEAIALYVENKEQIHAIILDMMMPYMDGPTTIRALQRLDPPVKIIASSGLREKDKSMEVSHTNVKAFLPKPYTAETLLTVLAEVLKRTKP